MITLDMTEEEFTETLGFLLHSCISGEQGKIELANKLQGALHRTTTPKPCPFCGKPGSITEMNPELNNPGWRVLCGDFLCDVHAWTNTFPTKQAAVRAWNKRA